MNSILKHSVGAAVFTAGLIAMIAVSKFFLVPKDNSVEAGMYDAPANGILAEPDNSIDVLVVGDSEVYGAIVPLYIWENYGIASYDCGTGAQKLGYTYEFLDKVFKTQSPKMVVLETNNIFRETSYGDIMLSNAEVISPFFAYHSRWKSFTKRDLDPTVNYTTFDPTKGYLYSDVIDPADTEGYMTPSDEKEPITALNRNCAERVGKFCKDRGVRLVMLSTPSTLNMTWEKHNALQELADDMGADYIDMNVLTDEVPIDWAVDTQDKGDHTNYTGACKVSDYLGRYFAENGLFTDRRGDPDYAQWDEAVAEFNASHK